MKQPDESKDICRSGETAYYDKDGNPITYDEYVSLQWPEKKKAATKEKVKEG